MLGWIFRALMIVSGMIAGLFVAEDALNFPIAQTAVMLILSVILVAIAAFWSPRKWYERFKSWLKK